MEMRSGNCTTKSKRPYLQNPRRHQLDEEKLGDPMTMFGKNDAPFQGGKKEKGPSWTGGEGQAYTDVRASMRLRGLCPHMQNPRLRRGIMILRKPARESFPVASAASLHAGAPGLCACMMRTSSQISASWISVPFYFMLFFLCFGANGFCNSTSYVRTSYCHSQLPDHIFTITSIRRFQRFCIPRLA